MFGYVVPFKEELKIKEYDAYRSYYCGLCKTLKRKYGFFSRLCLNYDSVFLALLLSSISDEEHVCKAERCIANPFRKRPVHNESRSLSYAADVMVILALLKLSDDIKDEHSIKAFFAYACLFSAKRKVIKNQKDIYLKSKERIDALSVLEKEKCTQTDKLAHEFASLLEFLFTPLYVSDVNTKRILAQIGYMLGRFIYILDAYEDIEGDKKKKRFNPYVLSNAEIDKENIRESLTLALSSISNCYELLDINKNKPILDNIIYLGLKNKLDNTIDKKGEENEKPL